MAGRSAVKRGEAGWKFLFYPGALQLTPPAVPPVSGANLGLEMAGHGQGHPEEEADQGSCKRFGLVASGLLMNSLIQIFFEQFPYVTVLAQVPGKCMPPKKLLLSEIRETEFSNSVKERLLLQGMYKQVLSFLG